MLMKKDSLPSPDEIYDYVLAQGGFVLRRDIARAFRLKGDIRKELRLLLKDMETQKRLVRRGKSYKSVELDVPAMEVVTFIGLNDDGDYMACPVHESCDDYTKTILLDVSDFKKAHALSEGDAVVVQKIKSLDENTPEIARVIRILQAKPKGMLGMIQKTGPYSFVLKPVDKKDRNIYPIHHDSSLVLNDGDLVEADLERGHGGKPRAVISEVYSDQDNVLRKLSLIAIHQYDLPYEFPEEVMESAQRKKLPPIGHREDLRSLDLVTIDDADARDHDDAVWAEPDSDPANPGGWHLIVAIADVSCFVQPFDVLDREALARSNSVYFPDQVVPMLPEKLSNDLCSLRPKEDRPCVGTHIWIDRQGQMLRYKFFRGYMKSAGKLTYRDVQASIEGQPNDIAPRLQKELIPNLYKAYKCLDKAREQRGTLDLDLPEQKVILNDDGSIKTILARARFESHKLIEEFMILANVASACFLSDNKVPTVFRIHDEPREERVEELRAFLKDTPASLPKGQVMQPKNFNQVLHKVKDLPIATAINQLVLRTQSQAEYNPKNIGHFGLSLARYCHFTSPIRRYADLIVHRGILSILDKQNEGYPYTLDDLESIAEEISEKERRASKAERDTVERYVARYLVDRVGETLPGKISGMTEFALFIKLDETGSDGILPLRNLRGDYYNFIHDQHKVQGSRTRHALCLGDRIPVQIEFADPLTGSLVFSANFNDGSGSSRKSSVAEFRKHPPKTADKKRFKKKR